MGRIEITSSAKTHVGQRRSHNEDTLFSDDEMGLYIVADGMGGHAAGEVASQTSIQAITQFISQYADDEDITWPFGADPKLTRGQNLLLSGIQMANSAVCEKARENPECKGMGTTIAAMYTESDNLIVAHVGDSRVYRFRGDGLEQLTEDHTWVNEQLEKNVITEEEARNHRWKNVITRALGNKETVEVDIQLISDVESEDLYLVCSDGLTTMMEDEEVRQKLLRASDNLEEVTAELINSANEKGGFDNISVILIRCKNPNDTPTVAL